MIRIARSSARCGVGTSRDDPQGRALTVRMASVTHFTARSQTVRDHAPSDRRPLGDSVGLTANTRPSIGPRFAASPVAMANTAPRNVVAQSIERAIIGTRLTVNPVRGRTIIAVPAPTKGEKAITPARTATAPIGIPIDRSIPTVTGPRYVVSRFAPSLAGQL